MKRELYVVRRVNRVIFPVHGAYVFSVLVILVSRPTNILTRFFSFYRNVLGIWSSILRSICRDGKTFITSRLPVGYTSYGRILIGIRFTGYGGK